VLGNVHLLDPAGTRVAALAVRDGKILAAGSREEAMQFRGRGTQVDDFADATVIPGFNDTHAHLTTVGLKTLRPSLAGCRSIRDVLARVRELAGAVPKGEWIVTMPVGEPPYYFDAPQGLAERRMPNRHELDSVAPDHPVYLSSPGGFWGQTPCHSALNSAGLALNGIDRSTRPTASGIEIEWDSSGEPTGVFIERNFLSVIEQDLFRAVPKFSSTDRVEALRRGMKLCHAMGTTSIYEGHGCAPDVLAAFRKLHENGELTMRSGLVIGPTWSSVEEAGRVMREWLPFARAQGLGDAMLRISGVFVPCFGDPRVNVVIRRDVADLGWGDYIRLGNTPGDFEQLCMLAGENDLRVHTVISNRLAETVPILERVAARFPIGDRRWVLEHISRSNPADLESIRRMGLGVTLIPGIYLWKGAHVFADLSPAELDYLSPAKQLEALGVPVSAGTDAVPYDPLHCMWVMVKREARSGGQVMGENGRLGNGAALRMLTVNGAWLTFEEATKGPLLPGYLADLAVFKRDPLSAVDDEILNNTCIGTMVGGRWVHGPQA